MAGPWEDYAPQAASSAGPWEDYAPAEPKKEAVNPLRAGLRSLSPVMASILENPQGALTAGGQLLKGGARGVKDVIDTGAMWAAQGFDALAGTNEGERVRAMNDAGKVDFKRDNPSPGASVGRFAGQMATTLPVGPLLGAGASALGAGRLGSALATSGMTTGGARGAGDLAIRTLAGGAVGGLTAGLVNPDDMSMGAGIGAALPGALQLAGKLGGTVYSAVKAGKPGAGRLLADALGVTEAELPAIIKAANAAPESLVPGSKLTLSQALQQQGANQPSVKMLERIAAAGPGGDTLLKRYADQGTARMDALRAQGAQTYQGAAREESSRAGNQIGALLRTQAGDEREALGRAWKGSDGLGGVYGRARDEGIALQLPIDRMKEAMSPLGRGSVMGGNDARNVLKTAEDIGTDVLPGLKPIPMSAGQTQSLEQAVRSQGGIQPGKYLNKEITELGRKQSKTTGLVSKVGRDVEAMATTMHERGFLPDNDPATLLQALRSGGGRRIFADDHMEAGFQRMAEAAAGDMPEAGRIAKAVPFDEFQRLRRDSGALAAKQSARPEGGAESGVLTQFQKLLAGRADDAAMGNFLPGENMTPGFMEDYNSARDMTRQFHERYSGGNNIAQILRKPAGQNYTLGGDEITNKLWHGGSGLQDDVRNLKNVLSGDNQQPAMKSLQQFIMSDAASKTKGSGDLGAALPRYVETRMPGLLEALDDGQFKALTGVASDIRNADAAAAVPGLLGSDTYAKASRAMDGGLLDSTFAKTAGRFLSFKGLGVEPVRAKLADMVMQHKGRTVSELLANPKAAAAALQDSGFVKSADAKTIKDLRLAVAAARAMPILAAD